MTHSRVARLPGQLPEGLPGALALLALTGLLAACGGDSAEPDAASDRDESAEQMRQPPGDDSTETGGMDDVAQVPAPTPDPSPAPPPPMATGQATYEFVFTAQWTAANGFGNVPGPAHFSGIIGAAVNEQSRLWASGEPASAGLEEVAEEGTVTGFRAQIQAEVAANAAREAMFVSGPRNSGTVSGMVTFSDAHPALTFVTMVAPSPDWFVGLNRQSMKDPSGQWLSSFDQQLPVYDAGTEDGDQFSTNGVTTSPQGVIGRLTATVAGSLPFIDGSVNGNAIARVQLRRIR